MLNPQRYSSFLSLNVNQSPRNREDIVWKGFIATEINELLEEGIIEPNDSPWRHCTKRKAYETIGYRLFRFT